MQIWLHLLQLKYFQNELISLMNKTSLKNSSLIQLQPFLDDDGIMRSKGRLQSSNLPEVIKYPIILPNKSSETTNFILFIHKTFNHEGPEATLLRLRLNYWIIQGRQTVKKALYRCQCYRGRARSFQPVMAPLPLERTEKHFHSFSTVACDMAGPFEILPFPELAPNLKAKTWITLFTCLTSRALVLDWSFSLSTETFIHSFVRLFARRGYVNVIILDQQPSFVRADVEIKKLFQNIYRTNVEKKFTSLPNPVEFQFSSPLASHEQGVIERMVQITKKSLRISLGKKRDITLEDFRTLLASAEMTANSRPLSAVSSSSDDLVPITPFHLMNGRSTSQLPTELVPNIEKNINKQWKLRSLLSKQYWNTWQTSYLLELNKMKCWHNKNAQQPFLNEIVLVQEPQIRNRFFWPLGRIIKLYDSKDGIIRRVTVRTYDGSQWHDKDRHVRSLYRLECP